jgi:hypothetical protein
MDILLPPGHYRWIDAVRREIATLGAAPGRPALEDAAARLAAHALAAEAPRAAQFAADRYRRRLIAGGTDAIGSCLLISWPAAHRTSLHDHGGLWGIELVLDGVLEVEEFAVERDGDAPRLAHRRTLMLGIGDAAVFADPRYAHRCRNLSSTRPALSLHVYGGRLERYRAFDADAAGGYVARSRQAHVEATLTA